jgi:lysozyme family protein
MRFEDALNRLLQHEGGYVDHPSDPGGETNFGITVAVAREYGYTGPMRDIPIDTVAGIYRQLYWNRVRADDLPAALRYPLFDAAVNSGVDQAVSWLQRALGVPVDGVIGRQTIDAALAADPAAVAARLCGLRLAMLSRLRHFEQFGRGWVRRVAAILKGD